TVSMTAMIAPQEIVGAQTGANSGGDGFFADVAMGRPLDDALVEELDGSILEHADPHHRSEDRFQVVCWKQHVALSRGERGSHSDRGASVLGLSAAGKGQEIRNLVDPCNAAPC